MDSTLKTGDSSLLQGAAGQRPPIAATNTKEKPLPTQSATGQAAPTAPLGTPPYGCGGSLSGAYAGAGIYTYPDNTLDLSSSAAGATISINATSYDVPNRFDVYDANGNLIVSSGWMGYATYSGPWGMSLNTPQSKTLTFAKATATYTFRVQTVTQGYSDSWNASVSCATPQVTINVNKLKFPSIALYEQYADNLVSRTNLTSLASGSSALTTLAEQDPNDYNDTYPDFIEQILNTDKIVELGSFFVKVDLNAARCLAIKSNQPGAYTSLVNNSLTAAGMMVFPDDASNVIEVLLGIEAGSITTSNYQSYIETSDTFLGLKLYKSDEILSFVEPYNGSQNSGPMADITTGIIDEEETPFGCRHARRKTDKYDAPGGVEVWNLRPVPNAGCPDYSNIKAFAMDNKVVYQKVFIYFSLQSKIKSYSDCRSTNCIFSPGYVADLKLTGTSRFIKRCGSLQTPASVQVYTDKKLAWRPYESSRSLSKYEMRVTFSIKHSGTATYTQSREFYIMDGF